MINFTKKGKLIRGIATFLIATVFLTSCSKITHQTEENTEVFSLNPNNENALSFNEQLGSISDEKSAKETIDSLMTYMGTRFATPSTTTMRLMQSGTGSDAVNTPTSNAEFFKSALNMELMASQEYQARNAKKKGLKVQSDAGIRLVSCEELSEQINSQISYFQVTSEEIRALQKDIRKALPNLAVDPENEGMAPLECSVITWVFMTGDDGTAKEGSMAPLSDEAIQAINQLKSTQGLKPQFSIVIVVVVILIVAAVACGIHDTYANTQGKDIFGNTVHEDEEFKSCVKVKKGKSTTSEIKTDRYSYDYYTFEDLDKFLLGMSPYVEFDTSKPGDALASLPSKPNTAGNISVASLKPAEASPLAKDGYELWWKPLAVQSKLKKGDIYFLRGDDTKHRMIAKISSWTHAGMVYDARDSNPKAFESTLYGVNLYNPKTEWHPMVSWSVKRVKSASENQINYAVDTAVQNWAGKLRYFPEWRKNDYTPTVWFKSWCDKNDKYSMFCFKTVYNTYKLININLDSNHTRISSSVPNVTDKYYAPDVDDNGVTVQRAFIGVTGDDIYYSKHVGPDLFSYGLENLSKPLLTQ